jgi:8-oxo-dGTP pyrophosphatase MutT (NUDIX family)
MFDVISRPMRIGEKHLDFELARRAPGVRIVVRDRVGERILLTREYRHELGREDLRLPGGKVFDTLADYEAAIASGETSDQAVLEAARREAREEVGLLLGDPTPIFVSPCGATVIWDLHFVLCTEFEQSPTYVDLQPGERITHHWTSDREVARACLTGELSEERSASLLLRLLAADGIVAVL